MIRLRASLRVRVILTIALVAIAPHLLVFAWSQLDRPVAGRLWFNVADVMSTASAAIAKGETPDYESLANGRRVRLRLIDERGESTVDVDHDAPTGSFDRLEAFFLRPSGSGSLRQIDDARGPILEREETRAARIGAPFIRCELEDLLYCQAIGRTRDPSGREVIVHVEQSSYRAVFEVYQLRSQLLRIGLILWPLAAVLAWVTGSRIVRPIERLRQQAVARAEQSAPLVPERRDEVADLAAAINAAFDRVESQRRSHEEFVADLVHELKSPAASVRACADTLEDGDGADERTKRVARVLRESSRKLESTVGRFLDLSRAEAGFPKEEREAVDLGELAESVVRPLRDDARFADVTFDTHVVGGVRVLGVAHRLESMLHELVENGATFVDRKGRVEVTVRADAGECELLVSDDGPGIPAADLPHVFERFYTTRGHARGSGLGLALVAAVAKAHGGSARVLPAREKGAAFSVRLPLFTPDS